MTKALCVRAVGLLTEQCYLQWIRRVILFHGKRHPREMREEEVAAFLTYLAVKKDVASATQNQALSALLFLYKKVVDMEPVWLEGVTHTKRPKRLPIVLPRETVRQLYRLTGTHRLVAYLIYGTGMRLMEAVRLRVKDIDFSYRQITIRGGNGDKDRITMLPKKLIVPLQRQLELGRRLFDLDRAEQTLGMIRRHHIYEKSVQRSIKRAVGSCN